MGGDRFNFENEPVPSGGTTTYTPGAPGNWSPAPTTVGGALDQVAARMTTAEANIAALQATAPQPQIYTCPMGAAVRDLVYQSASGAVDLADASDPLKMPAIGFIASKPTATTCVIQDEDELGGFSGLTPDVPYYASPTVPGGITATRPSVVGQVAQPIGSPKTATTLRIAIGVEPPEYL